jgi:hypothetical protein
MPSEMTQGALGFHTLYQSLFLEEQRNKSRDDQRHRPKQIEVEPRALK